MQKFGLNFFSDFINAKTFPPRQFIYRLTL